MLYLQIEKMLVVVAFAVFFFFHIGKMSRFMAIKAFACEGFFCFCLISFASAL